MNKVKVRHLVKEEKEDLKEVKTSLKPLVII